MINERGILLIATKHAYYGRMAFNLAATIKAAEPDMQICVLHAGRGLSHLAEHQMRVFDHIIKVDEGVEEIMDISVDLKLYAHQYSPFKKTLFIDADNLWLPGRKPSALFNELEGVKFTIITEGYYDVDDEKHDIRPDYFLWADPKEIINAWGITSGKIYQCRSEVFYFEKCDEIEAFFNTAKKIFYDPKVDVVKFAGTVPDEVTINIAANLHNIHPHVYRWQPTYWDKSNRLPIKSIVELSKNYWILSTGGNWQSQQLRKAYNTIVASSCHKIGVQHLFQLQPKRHILSERQKI